ncbi:5-formyltetrahydrofolate cyclo-ligase [Planococcus salinus]|uniref:5-formyltetrahydrofolate cyclo-ligase n=1 Tax=Planococcus salinus TaxID=1848460 RepID=A0A3M8PBQ8_9BACL|nr:5-formyltetrahydrofolate cyclo-ligase [Planococcus salinus]RNF41052.1 5-formyltetrahydrofolate cyclo-ligase [Planococcus salinus]
MDKPLLRKTVLNTMKQLDKQAHQTKSQAIHRRLLQDHAFVDASTVALTISAFPEVDTLGLITECWNAGKQVAVPKCIPGSRGMDFYVLETFEQLEVVYMQLKEPKVEETMYVGPEHIDLMIVPGVVFSPAGYRIGFGGGYYDRYLAKYKGPTRSLAFDLQLAERIPVEDHDIPVDGIHTESRFIDTKKVRA